MSLSALRAMDQYSQYLMWMKSQNQNILNFHFQATMNQFNNSWEEKAFADDSAGPLGGFVWPPRSYTCSFCKREFRSAQALGGHMNVHRRDRARLKQQSLTPQNEVVVHHQTCKSLDIASYPSQVCFTDSSNIDPNNANPSFLTSSSPHDSPSSRVSVSVSLSLSAMSTQENFSEHTYESPPFSSSIVLQEDHVGQLLNDSDSKTGFGKIGRKEDFTFLGHDDGVETSLRLGLNLVVSKNQPSGFDGDHEVITWKRHKTSGSLADLDLELRLGDPPKVK